MKHQGDCYRTFNGLRWPNFCDILDDEKQQAVAEAKDNGKRFRLRKHPDGYYQAFIHPDYLFIKNKKGVNQWP